MRAGNSSSAVQQTLTSEAASVLKHSLSLARRRGHAQITPLHVAATLLTSRLSLLRRACLKSQPPPHHHHPASAAASYPLQCRALELCFNVALNRLPTITSGALLLHGQPSLSNALVAALKRAQAHQRRGCIEQQQQQQQQPLLAVKVELEQLVLSILDDPSVSRVMREAGFSSTAVKSNLEDCSVSAVFQCYNSSGGIYSTPSSPPDQNPKEFISQDGIWTHLLSYSSEQNPFVISPPKKILSRPSAEIVSVKEDVQLVMEVLLRNKRRNCVIVSDSVSLTEGLVATLMGKVEEGDVPEELKLAHFIRFHFSSAALRFMKKEEVELNVSDLRRRVDSTLASGGKGVIIYAGDLKWIMEDAREGDAGGGNGLSSSSSSCEESGYSPVDHLVGEIGRLIASCSNSNAAKVWLVATANYQTYMRTQMKQPPLDIQWALQALFVPSGGLGLSLKAASFHDTNMASLLKSPFQVMDQKASFTGKGEPDKLTCCAECTSSYEKEAAGFSSSQQKSSSPYPDSCNNKNNIHLSSNELPYWLKQQGRNVAEKDNAANLKRKWNKLCQSLHQGRHDQNNARSIISNQCSFAKNDYYSSYPWWPSYGSMFLDNKSISFANESLKTNQSMNSVPRFRRQQSCHIEFNFSNGSSRGTGEPNLDSLKGREDKNVKITLSLGSSPVSDAVNCTEKSTEESVMSKVLQENVPWQSGSIPIIVEALMNSKELKKDTWFLILGNDLIGKRRLARGITELLHGSTEFLIHINLRMKEDIPGKNCEILKTALGDHGSRLVVLLEYVDFSDPELLEFLADGFRSGRMRGTLCKNEGNSFHPIFILTKSDSTSCRDDSGKVEDSIIQMEILVSEKTAGSGTTFHSDHKRKADWDLTNMNKIPREEEPENAHRIQVEKGRKGFTSELMTSKNLDLNMKADEEECGDETKELSPVSSDLTSNDQHNSLGFLDLIKNHFVLNRDSGQDRQIREMFLSNIRGSFEEVFGTQNLDWFSAEENVLEEISLGSGTFLHSLFQEWLKHIFQSSLKRINICKKEEIKVRLRLCVRGNGGSNLNKGFKGSCLPKDVHITYLD